MAALPKRQQPSRRRSTALTECDRQPGIHHGSVPHASEPITEGERHNLVLWLYGEGNQIPLHGAHHNTISPQERWTIPKARTDAFAPF